MKFFVVFLAFAMLISVQGLTDEEKHKISNNGKACLKETDVDVSLIDKTGDGDFDFDDAKTKQFYLCIFKMNKMIDDEGNINKVAVLSIVDEDEREKFDKVIDPCLDKKGDTMEDIAWNFMKCFRYNMAKHHIVA